MLDTQQHSAYNFLLHRAKASSGALILESGLLNAQAPTVADTAAALPIPGRETYASTHWS